MEKKFRIIIPLLLVIVFFFVLILWLLRNPAEELSKNLPGQDNRPPIIEDTNQIVQIGEKFAVIKDAIPETGGSWPGFRGPERDNIDKRNTNLIDRFPENGPEILWKVELGEGHAAAAIKDGKVFILDYYEAKKSDVLRCYSLNTGEELWKRWYGVHVKRNHGFSRTIPAVSDSFVVSIGPKCHVMCCNQASGELVWGIDLVKEYGTEVPFWNTGQCPLIDNNVAIIAPAGKDLLIGVECNSGKVLWRTPNQDNYKMSHSSVMTMTVNKKKTYVYAAIGGIVGVSAEGSDIGKILWKTTEFSPSVIAPSPLILDNGKIFITAGYGAGSILFSVKETNGQYKVDIIQKFKPKDGMASEQQTPIYYNGKIYCIQPKDAGGLRNQFVCCSPQDFTRMDWTSGSKGHFGLGPYIVADNKFFILDDDGTLTIADALVDEFRVLDKRSIIEGQDAWGPLAIADGMLILRDSKHMVCVNLKKEDEN